MGQGQSCLQTPPTPPSSIPGVTLLTPTFPPEPVNMAEYCAGKKVVIVGVPGAFTPVCQGMHLPTYLENLDKLKEVGVDEVIVVSVNDCSVMGAWAKESNIEGTMVNFLADPHGEFAKTMCLELTHPVGDQLGFIGRSKRFAIYAVDGKIKFTKISYSDEDPVGAEDKSSYAEVVIQEIRRY